MKILYAAMKYDYGERERGPSFEHCTFFDALQAAGHEIIYFDFLTLYQRYGSRRMSRMLLETAQRHKPDLAFFVLFQEEFIKSAVRRLTASGVPTVNWFCDDHWRFDVYSRHWAPCFKWVVTTHRPAVERYHQVGCPNVILSQWACNDATYRPTPGPMLCDVSFVGQAHSDRRRMVEAVRAAGIRVEAFGRGWENGRVETARMVEIFSRSRINLNFTSAFQAVPDSREIHRQAIAHRIRELPLGPEIASARRLLGRARAALRKGPPAPAEGPAMLPAGAIAPAQIKGRNFEVPGCGGFLLTGPVEFLEEYYEPGREVVCFNNTPDLIEKIRFYLSNESERQAIARAGFQRTLREHTYARRFASIFQSMGLSTETKSGAGSVLEIL